MAKSKPAAGEPMSNPPIPLGHVAERAQQGTGREDLTAFLERIRPDVQAIELFLWTCGTMVRSPGEHILRLVMLSHHVARNASHLLPLVDDVMDQLRLDEDEYRRLYGRGLEVLIRLAEARREIIDRRIATGHRGDHLRVSTVFVNWFGAHEDDYPRVHGRALEMLRQVEHYRALAGLQTSNDRRKARRKIKAKHGALLTQLEDTHAVLTVFVEDYPRVGSWIREVVRRLPSCTSRAW
jgi:hypothetical protein